MSGSLDVVLAAHCLYHLESPKRGLTEIRRALRSGGTLLAVTNSIADKAEISQVWSDAAADVLGLRASGAVVSWAETFSLENGPDLIRPHFAAVDVFPLPGTFRFTTPEPVIDRIESMRTETQALVPEPAWRELIENVRTRVGDAIRADGAFNVTKLSGVIRGIA